MRLDAPDAADARRWIVGLAVTSKCDRIAAALVGVGGAGLGAVAEVVGGRTAAVPRSTAALFDALSGPTPVCHDVAGDAADPIGGSPGRRWCSTCLDGLGMAPGHVLAIGVDDPGIWQCEGDEPVGYLGLCDPARLAEATGLNVIDAFPARDLAAGGQGGPLTALAEWVLLGDHVRSRVLLDLGRTTALTYLPAARAERAETRILSFQVGPGVGLLDALAQRLTGGQHLFDPGGRLAVQGKRIAELVEHWMSNPYFDGSLPRWHPHGVRPERFLTDALQMAVAAGWSVRDLLCTATHFIAEMVARTLRGLPNGAGIDEIVVTGGGQHNGMLLHEIARLAGLPLPAAGRPRLPGRLLRAGCRGHLGDAAPRSGARQSDVDHQGRHTPAAGPADRRLAAELATVVGNVCRQQFPAPPVANGRVKKIIVHSAVDAVILSCGVTMRQHSCSVMTVIMDRHDAIPTHAGRGQPMVDRHLRRHDPVRARFCCFRCSRW